MYNTSYGSKIVLSNETLHIQERVMYVVNLLANKRMTTYLVYRKLINENLNIKSKTPLYINDFIVLFPIKSYKEYSNIWINFKRVKKINFNKKDSEITFFSGNKLKITMSKHKWNNIVDKIKKIECYYKTLSYKLM